MDNFDPPPSNDQIRDYEMIFLDDGDGGGGGADWSVRCAKRSYCSQPLEKSHPILDSLRIFDPPQSHLGTNN
uniref:Uncharacterized protein n=2 Tax=Sarcoptes scabiei TaxID=52283 RepID=A0A834REP3_SARSC